jgi:hypothetical protein
MIKLGKIEFIVTITCLFIIINKKFKINALHASILFVCSFFYQFFCDIPIDIDYNVIDLLKSFIIPAHDGYNITINELHERVYSAILWIGLCYPVFCVLYYMAYKMIKALLKKFN